jgi:serine/threonine protein kinase
MARFRREADIARRLTHPQIAHTYDVLDGPDQSPALVMEWLSGPNLRDRILADGPMPPREVAAIGRVLAAALDYIAGEQVVRLDLKPSNIVMADRGPVIVDLGIALRADSGTQGLTQTGQFVGTPAFMAPELVEGRQPDPRADIYALGLVLFYCLAGRGPWEDLVGHLAIIAAIMNEQVDLTNLPISTEFCQVIGRAIAKDRDERYATAAELRDALTETPEWRLVGVGHGKPDDDILPK